MGAPRTHGRAGGSESRARRAVAETARAMSRRGLSPGRSGNVSCRWRDGLLVTPSGVAYADVGAASVVFVGPAGGRSSRGVQPSTEWRLHQAVYRVRPDVGAVVHAHSLNATVLACAQKPIPAFHYMVATAGGKDVPLVPYATFGTEDLARHVASALVDRDACLLANHGQVAVGADLASALELAAEVEVLAEQYAKVLALGKPRILDDVEMARVLEAFATYGRRAPARRRARPRPDG
jgi:L-fuculose-phosphate aldolase